MNLIDMQTKEGQALKKDIIARIRLSIKKSKQLKSPLKHL